MRLPAYFHVEKVVSIKNLLLRYTFLLRKNPFILVIITVLVLVLFFATKMRVAKVVCFIENNLCPHIYSIDMDSILKSNLILINSDKIALQIINSNPTIGKVGVHKRFPNTIEINLIARTPQYLLITPEQTLAVDRDGMAMALSGLEIVDELTPIESKESFAVGQKIVSPSVLSAIKLIQLLDNSALRLRSVSISELSDITVIMQDGMQLRFSGQRDMNKQVDSVKAILGQPLKDATIKIREIDMRFDDPIIK